MHVNSTKHGLQVGRLLATLRVWSTKTDCLKYRSREKKKCIIKEMSTFLSWGKEQIIGYRSEENDFWKTEKKIWCKVCAQHKDEILNDPKLKVDAATAAKAFINVTKHQVVFLISCCEHQKQPHRTFLAVNRLEADRHGIL